MNIFQLLEMKTKKELKRYLKNNAIQYKKSFHALHFKAIFFDVSCIVHIDMFHKKIISYCIVMDREKYTYPQMTENILKIKNELIPILGKPKFDNTNHLNQNCISIHFEDENSSISLVCHSEREHAAIVLYNKQENAKNKKSPISSKVFLWITSFIGGLIWGLIMFVSMGASYGYTLADFGIWMCGGVVFGVAFASIFGLCNKTSNNKPKFPKKKIERILQEFSLEKETDLILGNLFIFQSHASRFKKQHVVPALMKMTDFEITIYSLVKKTQICLKMPLNEAFYQMQSSAIQFKKDDANYLFAFSDNESFKKIESDLFDKLIRPETFSSLFLDLKKATKEFNPYSVYDTNSDEILDGDIKMITKILLAKDDIQKSDLRYLLYSVFDCDEYCTEALMDIYFDIYKKFVFKEKEEK